MADLRELYQQVILDHGRHPRHFGQLPEANHQYEGFNPLCGDRLTVYLNVQEDIIQQASFIGTGCAISMASASLMMENLTGKTKSELDALFSEFHHLVTGEQGDESRLGKLAIFKGVFEFPMRVKCATLCWHTALAAMTSVPEHSQEKVK
jgi:nitrogen fixation NifU-like protein